MARTSRRQAKRATRRRNATPWLIGAGILVLVVTLVTLNLVRWANLPGEFVSSQGKVHITSNEFDFERVRVFLEAFEGVDRH